MIADNIKKIIQQKGIKQKAIANTIGMSEQRFSDLLNGRKSFDVKFVVPIAKALGVTPNDLFNPNKSAWRRLKVMKIPETEKDCNKMLHEIFAELAELFKMVKNSKSIEPEQKCSIVCSMLDIYECMYRN